MAVQAEFAKNANLGGPIETVTLHNGWRYARVHFSSAFRNQISSMRAVASSGRNGNVYGFTESGFLGNYTALNVPDGGVVKWNLGSAVNDNIESTLLVHRRKSGEIVLGLRELIADDFAEQMDAKLEGTGVSRDGAPRVYSLFWPGHAPGHIYVSIEQNLTVHVPNWFDYEAQVRYDVQVYLTKTDKIDAFAAWTYVWVEGGILSKKIFNSLQPSLVAGMGPLTKALRAKLAAFAGVTFQDLYLLPGAPPDGLTDHANAKDGSTLVLIP